MVKLDIISGFLGAGKTTLINKLLNEAYIGERPVLIENEFGDVDIDNSLIEDPDIQVRLLSSGCICCTLKSGFVEGIRDVVNEYNPSRIIIEPTGLADPEDILSACEEAGRAVSVAVNSFITVANAQNLLPLLAVGGKLFRKQVSGAGFLLLNRVHLLTPDEKSETLNIIKELNPACIVLEQGEEHLDSLAVLVMAEEAAVPFYGIEQEHHHSHGGSGEDIASMAFYPEKAYTQEELERIIKAFSEEFADSVLRAKGFLKRRDGGFANIQYVYGCGKQTESGYNGPPKLVVIGKSLDKPALTRCLEGVSL